MHRRKFMAGSAAAAAAVSLPRIHAQAQAAPEKIRIGYAISLSGPLGPGAESTTVSQYKLWQKRTNDSGGILLKKFGRKVPIELIEYDDRGQPDELLKLTERLIERDRVDLILSPYATHMNLAAAPILNKYEYPTIMTTAGSAQLYQLAQKWPYAFWSLAQPNEATTPLAACARRSSGRARSRAASRRCTWACRRNGASRGLRGGRKKEGLEIVLSKSYPFGAADLLPLMREAMSANPDAFIAFSYPPDTIMLTEQAQTLGFVPPIMYLAIGTAFPVFKAKFGNNVNGIMMYDGLDTSAPGSG